MTSQSYRTAVTRHIQALFLSTPIDERCQELLE